MKTYVIQILLIALTINTHFSLADETDPAVTLRKYFAKISFTDKGLRIKTKESGQRWIMKAKNERERVLGYGEEVNIPMGGALLLFTKHIRLNFFAHLLEQKETFLIEESLDMRSFGKGRRITQIGIVKTPHAETLISLPVDQVKIEMEKIRNLRNNDEVKP